MADFYQGTQITTMHQFGNTVTQADAVTETFAPVAILIPIHANDLMLPGVQHIARLLADIPWVTQVVICIDHADCDDLTFACEIFTALQHRATIVHTNGREVQALFTAVVSAGAPGYVPGKGSNVCVGLWHLAASDWQGVIALHDIDIVAKIYNENMLARLVAPVARSELGLDFCKAYYARIHENQFKGRVTRLLFLPLLDVLIERMGPEPFLLFLREFRYLLSGEVSMSMNLARRLPVSAAWGYDLRLLAEIWRRTPVKRIGQCAICGIYDHRHPQLHDETLTSPGRSNLRGVSGMVVDIYLTLWQILTDLGLEWNQIWFAETLEGYRRKAAEYIERYRRDAVYNGLFYNSTEERRAVEAFIAAARKAETLWQEGVRDHILPSWDDVVMLVPRAADHVLGVAATVNNIAAQ